MIDRDKTIRELEREYMDDVRSIAEEAAALPEDERGDFIHESVDGSAWVIYTYAARMVAVLTEHPDAYDEDEMGEPAPTVEAAAYSSMRADVERVLPGYVEEAEDEEEDEDEEGVMA